jgi:hypothetical protein
VKHEEQRDIRAFARNNDGEMMSEKCNIAKEKFLSGYN